MLKTAILILLLPVMANALGISYFEFNPDYYKTQSLNISTEGLLYEIFLPVNEFFGGFDMWFDNSGSSGQATFELHDPNNTLMTSKTVTVSHINPIEGGQAMHVDWDSQLPVNGSAKYKIKIASDLPQLRIYYADRIGFLGHNAPYSSGYINGVAQVGGEEKQYSFKFSLYERAETAPPILSNVNTTLVSYKEARLDFNTNEPVDYKVDYGLAGQAYAQFVPFSGIYSVCNSGIILCSTTLNINPETDYQYSLTVKDVWGNQSFWTGTFNSRSGTTPTINFSPTPIISLNLIPAPSQNSTPTPTPIPTNPNTTPPVISNLKIDYLTDKSVHISWETNKAADSSLLISFTTEKITIAAATDSTQELLHFLKIDGQLNPKTKYLATIASRDTLNNITTTAISFTTLALGQVSPVPASSPQVISSQLPSQQSPNQQNSPPTSNSQNQTTPANPVIANQTNNKQDIIVTWLTPASEPSFGYRIDVFDENKKLLKTETVKPGVHQVIINGVGKSNNTVIVYKNNSGVYEKVSAPVKTNPEPTLTQRLLDFWPMFLTVLALMVGLLVWKLFFEKKVVVLPPAT